MVALAAVAFVVAFSLHSGELCLGFGLGLRGTWGAASWGLKAARYCGCGSGTSGLATFAAARTGSGRWGDGSLAAVAAARTCGGGGGGGGCGGRWGDGTCGRIRANGGGCGGGVGLVGTGCTAASAAIDSL